MVCPVDMSPVAGYCPAAIHQAAAKQRADLIILSTHGRTGLRRAFVGSVAEGTVRSAACPVLVVPSFASTRKKFVDKSARRPVMQRSNKVGAGLFEPRASKLIGQTLLARLLHCGRATRAWQSRAQEMRGISQLLRSRNLICPEEWKHEDASYASAHQRQ